MDSMGKPQPTLCEHDLEPDECPICAAEESEQSFDPYAWADAYDAPRPDVVIELTGVPLS